MSGEMTSNLMQIPIAKIRIREDKIRDVQRNEKFDNLKLSIKEHGLLTPITVCLDKKNKGGYVLIAGLHRLTAMSEEGHMLIDAKILEDIDEDETNFAQFIENTHRQNQSPMQAAKAIQRMLALPKFEGMSKKDILLKLGLNKTPQWLDNHLNLTELVPEAEELLESGDLSVSNASQLGKLDAEDQLIFLDRAKAEPSGDFVQTVTNRLEEIRAENKGQNVKDLDPLRFAKMRTKTELKAKYNDMQSVVLDENCSEFDKGFFEGLAYSIRMDADSIEERESAENEREEQRKRDLAERAKLIEKQKEAARQRREAREQAAE